MAPGDKRKYGQNFTWPEVRLLMSLMNSLFSGAGPYVINWKRVKASNKTAGGIALSKVRRDKAQMGS